MPPDDDSLHCDEYRLVLVKAGLEEIWTERVGSLFHLPRVRIPAQTRPAEQLQQAVAARWHIRTALIEFLPGGSTYSRCAIAEILHASAVCSLSLVAFDEIPEMEMKNDEREVVRAILAGDTGDRGPFSRTGWLKEAMAWSRTEAGNAVALTGEFRQFNANGRFALVRFASEAGPDLWLKATGEPNAHEFHITRKLKDLCPEHLPPQIAMRADWNAWLMEDAGLPADSWTLPVLEQVVHSMASLQKKTVGHTSEFLELGAFDQRTSTLRAHLDEIVDYLDEAMGKQVSIKVPRIDKRRLGELKDALENACFHMEALGISDTLIHYDLSSGNILFNGAQCVFTDWCEVGIGNPFFSFQYLCLLQQHGDNNGNSSLQGIYRRCWLDHFSTSQMDQAFALAPLLAILAYLYGRGTWLRASRRNELRLESYARSLARRMDRASRDSKLLEVLCQ